MLGMSGWQILQFVHVLCMPRLPSWNQIVSSQTCLAAWIYVAHACVTPCFCSSLTAESSDCVSCTDGTSSFSGSSQCDINCGSGTFSTIVTNFSCATCPQGTFAYATFAEFRSRSALHLVTLSSAGLRARFLVRPVETERLQLSAVDFVPCAPLENTPMPAVSTCAPTVQPAHSRTERFVLMPSRSTFGALRVCLPTLNFIWSYPG